MQAGCRAPKNTNDDPDLYLRVRTPSGQWHVVNVPEGAHDVLWAPDSKAFFVDGGISSYSGFFVEVYRIRDNFVIRSSVTNRAQRDMVRTFPPCKAFNRDDETCHRIEADPEFNMSGLAWATKSSIIVMAEVPCSSSYGGIMCAVEGYQLEVPGGRIEKRLTAGQLKALWQPAMAWNMRIPEPPRYGAAQPPE